MMIVRRSSPARCASFAALFAAMSCVTALSACGDDPVIPSDPGGVAGEPGLLTVHTSTTGRWMPDEGAQVLIDDDPATVRQVDLNGSLEVLLPPGEHTVELFRGGGRSFYSACGVDGGHRRNVTMEPGGSALADFEIFCEVVLDLEVSTTGTLTDTDGYRVIVSPYAIDPDFAFLAHSLSPNDRVVYDRESSPWWWWENDPQTRVFLWGEAPNCTILGPNPVALNPGGGVLNHEVTVECVDPPPATGTIYFNRGGDLHRIEADGTGLTQISDGWGMEDWTLSPDGNEVIFTSWTAAGGCNCHGYFFRASVDGTGLTEVTPQDRFDGEELHWGANGRLYYSAYSEANERQEVYSIRLDGTDRRRVSEGIGWHPALSPDGSKLIYEGPSGLVLSDADGANVRPVPFDTHVVGLAWSPDGTRVAGVGRRQEGWPWLYELLVFDPLSGQAEAVRSSIFDWRIPFAWSPDGSELVYAATQSSPDFPYDFDADADFFRVSADGYNLARLTTSGIRYLGRMAWED